MIEGGVLATLKEGQVWVDFTTNRRETLVA